MENNQNIPQQNHPFPEEEEFDYIQYAKTAWNGRKTIIKTILIFMGIGLFVAIFSEKEYTASTTFVPQTSDGVKIGGNLGGLAAMASINLGSIGGDSGISPELYPQIINSIPFQLELLQTPLTIDGQIEKVTYANYYTNIHTPGVLGYIKKYTIGLPGVIITAIKGKSESTSDSSSLIPEIQNFSIEEHKLFKQLEGQITLDVNNKDGYVTISANMPEAVSSAELAYKAEELLQQYVIDFKIKKSKEQLNFVQERYTEKGKEFKAIQHELARFRDQNININSALAQTKREQLQAEYDIAFSVFNELAKQLETQQLQVKEDTPVFTVLKPVSVPIKKHKPKRPLILILWTLFGGIVGTGIVLGKEFIIDLRRKWNNIEQ